MKLTNVCAMNRNHGQSKSIRSKCMSEQKAIIRMSLSVETNQRISSEYELLGTRKT